MSGQSFSGEHGMLVYRATIIASGLRFYAKTGMKMNRAYTPSNMLKAATDMTGRTFKRGQYEEAARALTELAQLHAPAARALGEIS